MGKDRLRLKTAVLSLVLFSVVFYDCKMKCQQLEEQSKVVVWKMEAILKKT